MKNRPRRTRATHGGDTLKRLEPGRVIRLSCVSRAELEKWHKREGNWHKRRGGPKRGPRQRRTSRTRQGRCVQRNSQTSQIGLVDSYKAHGVGLARNARCVLDLHRSDRLRACVIPSFCYIFFFLPVIPGERTFIPPFSVREGVVCMPVHFRMRRPRARVFGLVVLIIRRLDDLLVGGLDVASLPKYSTALVFRQRHRSDHNVHADGRRRLLATIVVGDIAVEAILKHALTLDRRYRSLQRAPHDCRAPVMSVVFVAPQ